MDSPRAAARKAIAELHAISIKRMIRISGDHQKVADAIARDIGLAEAWGDLIPGDKVEAIKKLRNEQKVTMAVHDGSTLVVDVNARLLAYGDRRQV